MRNPLFILALVFIATSMAFADDRAPVPTPAQSADAEKLVRDVYKEDFAKRGPEERLELAHKLLNEGKANKADAPSQYVLLRDSRDAAIQVGNVETVMAAIDAMNQSFVINDIDMKADALQSMKTTVHSTNAQLAAAEAATSLIDEAMAANNFNTAGRAADLGLAFATGGKDMAMVADIQARKNDIKGKSAAYLAMKVAEEKLKKDPKDAASNYAVGIYMALYQNDWDKGLPLLAQGNDPALADAAKADVGNPVELNEMTRVADKWFDLASTHPTMKVRLLSRAEFWYSLVGPKADGLTKAKVAKRLEQIAASNGGAAIGPGRQDTLENIRNGQFFKPRRASRPTTYFKAVSTGGYIAGSHTFDDGEAQLQVNGSPSSLTVGVEGYRVEFMAPQGAFMKPGEYNNAKRAAFRDNSPGLDFSGNGRGSNTVAGKFVVWEFEVKDNRVVKAAIDFEFRSEGSGPPICGMVRYHSNLQ